MTQASQALKVYPKLQPFAKKPTFKSTEQFGYGENEDYQAGHKGYVRTPFGVYTWRYQCDK